MDLYIVKAFTSDPAGGNYAGVVPVETDFPADSAMAALARELGYSETVFALNLPDGRFHLRYFTPTGEIGLCGHATVAAFAVLRQRGLADGDYRMVTQAGELSVTVGDQILMDMAEPQVLGICEAPDDLKLLYGVLGADAVIMPYTLRPRIISTGLKDIILPVHSRQALADLKPDFPALASLSEQLGVVGVHAFCLGSDCTAYCRNFAPACGIDEEAATGTASGALTWYLFLSGLLPESGTAVFRQGEELNSPSEIHTSCVDGLVRVGGPAVILEQRTVIL